MRSSVLVLLSGALCDISRPKRSEKKRALGERNIMELVLSKQRCALISSAMDDCKIASCKDDERNKVNQNGEIPVGAICRIKCRSVKATRCRCCKAGFEIGKKCPEEGDEDNCELEVDHFALYEGPNANLFPALDWRGCYQECINRGMDCHAASFVKLRFNSMCWIFNEVTTRYGDEKDDTPDGLGGPTRELFGLGVRSGKRTGKQKHQGGVQQKDIFDIPVDMRPVGLPSVDGIDVRSGLNPLINRPDGGFRAPTNDAHGVVSIAKGDAVKPGTPVANNKEPVMISWYRECQMGKNGF